VFYGGDPAVIVGLRHRRRSTIVGVGPPVLQCHPGQVICRPSARQWQA
jgi:hypothetical protein